MASLRDLRVKIFADGAEKAGMLELYRNPLIKGFTTNPSLMRKVGVLDYEGFAREIIRRFGVVRVICVNPKHKQRQG